MEDEHADPVGSPPSRDPLREFRIAAEASGAIRKGDPMDQTLIDFAYAIVERCACTAEPFVDDHDHSAAEAIRAELGAH